MRKNLLYILPAGLLLLAVAGCSKDELAQDESSAASGEPVDMVFHAGRPDATTRTVMDAYGAITWLDTDRICVNGLQSDAATITGPNHEYANFHVSGIVESKSYYALYPYSMFSVYSDISHYYLLGFPSAPGTKGDANNPGTQPWKDNESFWTDINPSVAYSANNYLTFYNICGILKVTFTRFNVVGTPIDIKNIDRARFIAYGQYVSGSGMVYPGKPLDERKLKIPSVAGNEQYCSNMMDVTFPADTHLDDANPSITIYMVLPPNSYTAGWKIQLIDVNGYTMSEITSKEDLTIERGKITNLKTIHMRPAGARIYLDKGDDENSDADDRLMLTNDPNEPGLYFKFGSVIGIRAEEDNAPFDAADVVFNPTTYSPIDKWVVSNTDVYVYGINDAPIDQGYVPSYNSSDYSNGYKVSDNTYHTVANLMKGKGDPCKLVGYKISDIKQMLSASPSQLPDNGTYRLPDKSEIETLISSNWSIITDQGAKSESGVFLPTVGSRFFDDGDMRETTATGYFWSSEATMYTNGGIHGFYLYIITKGSPPVTPGVSLKNIYVTWGYPVRCVYQTPPTP